MSKDRWVIDITTLNGVESNFHRGGPKDLDAAELAGKLADFYAYATQARYILPSPGPRAAGFRAPSVPSLVRSLQRRDARAFKPLPYLASATRTLRDRYFEEALRNFLAWCNLNPRRLKQWLRVHSQPWITGGHAARVPDRYVYDIAGVERDRGFITTARAVGISRSDLAYAFDVALRYGYYGELAAGGVYLSHPLREEQKLPTMTVKPAELPPIALAFGPSVARVSASLNVDQYTSLLHEIRAVVDSRQLRRVRPNAIESREIRQIAADLDLPVQLKSWRKAAGVSAAVVGAIAAVPTVAVAATVGAAAIGLGGIFWDGALPRQTGRLKWLRWALHWRIEG